MKKILPLIKTWQPSSWKSLPIKQSPDWPSNELVEAVKKLESFPPLIPFDEIDSLKKQFKRVSDDKRRYQLLSKNALLKSKLFSIQSTINQVQLIYEKCDHQPINPIHR